MFCSKIHFLKCGYTKAPTTHKGRGGIVMKVGNKWVYNACGEEIGNTLYAKVWSRIQGQLS